MRTTVLLKENRTQLVLHPETGYEEDLLKMLSKLPNAQLTNLYDRQGGYTAFGERWLDDAKDLMIIFDDNHTVDKSDLPSVTGQEWYEKYQENLEGKIFPHHCANDVVNIASVVEACNAAAKKAAGIW